MTVIESIDKYGDAWNENDAETRRALLREVLAEHAVYCDPTVEVTGADGLAKHIGQTRQAFGDYRIDRTSGWEEHHGYGRFAWRMSSTDDEVIVEGFDVVRVDRAGRLQTIIGFFGPFPER